MADLDVHWILMAVETEKWCSYAFMCRMWPCTSTGSECIFSTMADFEVCSSRCVAEQQALNASYTYLDGQPKFLLIAYFKSENILHSHLLNGRGMTFCD